MAAFVFALQALLDQRAAVEAAARRALIEADEQAQRETAALRALEDDLARHAAPLRACAKALEGADIRRTLLEIELVRSAADVQRRRAVAAGRSAADARAEFATARTERRQLEVLRERSYVAYLEERERREAAEFDEANAERNTISP